MSDYTNARNVLIKTRDEILNELRVCGQNGGTGRALQYAPQLVNIQGALDALDRMEPIKVPAAEKMAKVTAAKAVK